MCQFFVHNIWQYAAVTFIYGLFLAGAVPNINARLVEVTDFSARQGVWACNQRAAVRRRGWPAFGRLFGRLFADAPDTCFNGCNFGMRRCLHLLNQSARRAAEGLNVQGLANLNRQIVKN